MTTVPDTAQRLEVTGDGRRAGACSRRGHRPSGESVVRAIDRDSALAALVTSTSTPVVETGVRRLAAV